ASHLVCCSYTSYRRTRVLHSFPTRRSSDLDESRFKHFFHAMLDQGIYLPPSPFETWFLADSLTKDLLDQTIEAADKSLHIVKERSEEHTSELQSRFDLVCRLLLEKKKINTI